MFLMSVIVVVYWFPRAGEAAPSRPGAGLSAIAQTSASRPRIVERVGVFKGGYMNERSPYVSSILFFLAGGLAGAGASLLLAPRSGRDTREAIARRVGESARSVRGLRDRVLTRGRDAASAIAGNGEQKAEEILEAPSPV
jgi:hypothetical protein